MAITHLKTHTHVVDIIGNVIGRDQPIMLMEKAIELSSCLGEENLKNNDLAFFDPFCKAGEILLACALLSCWSKSKDKLIDLDEVKNELYQSKRYFGLAPDERHYRLSLRTFLGNKYSHQQEYTHIIRDGHYLSEIDGRLDKEKFNKELDSMLEYIKKTSNKHKIVVVGNPPYQEADGGAKASAKPIYNFFVEQMINHNEIDEFMLVIPARWFSAGKGLDKFRSNIMNSSNIKHITYYERSEDVFPTVHVQGGICFLNWCKNHDKTSTFQSKGEAFKVNLSEFDIIPDDPKATPIINKIIKFNDKGFISDVAWSAKPFGLRTFYFQRNSEINQNDPDAIKCYTKGKKVKYIKRSLIKVNSDKIDLWKVAIPGAYATGARRCTLPKHQIFIIEKGSVCTETYNIVSTFKTKTEAERLIAYLQTDFSRYLLGLRKITQHIPKDRWAWVPMVDLNRDWNDEALAKFFKLTKEEQAHIKKKVEEWS